MSNQTGPPLSAKRRTVWISHIGIWNRLWLALFSLVLAACAAPTPYQAYDGPRLSDADHVYVTGETEKYDPIWVGTNKQVSIRSIDGKTLGFLETPRSYPTAVLLTPGQHTLGLSFTYLNIYAHHDMQIDVQAGRSYLIRRAFSEPITPGNTIRFWLEELTARNATKSD